MFLVFPLLSFEKMMTFFLLFHFKIKPYFIYMFMLSFTNVLGILVI